MRIDKQKRFLLGCFILFAFSFSVPLSFVSAATARLQWNANTESDLAGYEVYKGTVPRAQNNNNYASTTSIGKVTTYTDNSISDTGTTYFAIKAINTSNIRSEFSVEVKKTPGDVDKDGDVDIFDYTSLKENFGQTNCDNPADIDLTCNVGLFDYNLLKGNFGARAQ
jgi:hypothetical protein